MKRNEAAQHKGGFSGPTRSVIGNSAALQIWGVRHNLSGLRGSAGACMAVDQVVIVWDAATERGAAPAGPGHFGGGPGLWGLVPEAYRLRGALQ